MTDGGSILDKIIASKEDQAKMEFHPADVINQLLQQLSDKESDVLRRRYGLNGSAKETLEAIGKSYDVTRERVRQIESFAVKKIKSLPAFSRLMKPVEHVIVGVLEQHGGLMQADHLLDELFPLHRTAAADRATTFLLTELLDQRLTKVGSDQQFKKGWLLKTADANWLQQATEQLIQCLRTANKPLDLTQIEQRLNQTTWYKQQAERFTSTIMLALLEASAQIDRNPFDEYGLRSWGSIVPKRMNDKIYLILKKVGKPMHFVDIAKQITEVFKKEAYPPTVHNELILNQQYVLIGRGIYALREWGYQSGVVADVVAVVLKQRGQPMSRDDIVATVLKQRQVKRNTIHLALTNKTLFTKLPDGRYTLAATSASLTPTSPAPAAVSTSVSTTSTSASAETQIS